LSSLFCPYCGSELKEDYAFCRNCGKRVTEEKAVATPEVARPLQPIVAPPPPQAPMPTLRKLRVCRKLLAIIFVCVVVVLAYLLLPSYQTNPWTYKFPPQDFIKLSVKLLHKESYDNVTILVEINNLSPWPIRFQGVELRMTANWQSVYLGGRLARQFPDEFTLFPFGQLTFPYQIFLIQFGRLVSIERIQVTITGGSCILFSPWQPFRLEYTLQDI